MTRAHTIKTIVEFPWRRGHYVAEITGPDPRWKLARDIRTDGTPIKTRRCVAVTFTRPCFIELGGWSNARGGKYRDYYAVDAIGYHKIPDGVDIAVISAGPPPGEPGSYGDGRCACREPVAEYDANGIPTCEDHSPTPMSDATVALVDQLIDRMTA